MSPESSELEPLPLSLLNDFLYCPRRAALKLVEGWREANEHTVRGDIVHEHADLAGYEVAKGVSLLRALPVWSERLGLSGKCDIVEVESNARPSREPRSSGRESAPSSQPGSQSRLTSAATVQEFNARTFSGNSRPDPLPQGEGERFRALRPVEYKKGKRRQFENDDAQLCA